MTGVEWNTRNEGLKIIKGSPPTWIEGACHCSVKTPKVYGARHSFANVRVGGGWTAVPSQKRAGCQRDGEEFIHVITAEFTEVKESCIGFRSLPQPASRTLVDRW